MLPPECRKQCYVPDPPISPGQICAFAATLSQLAGMAAGEGLSRQGG
jgi:hypothetical protein